MLKFRQAYWYHKNRRGYNGDGKIHGVVIHSMESEEKGDTAESVANYFATGSGGRKASADVCFDSNSEIECVKPTDEAYHAPPASRYTRGYEQAGRARQTSVDWHDPYSWAMIQRVGTFLGIEAAIFRFPIRFLDAKDMKAGHIDGVRTHDGVSEAYGQSDHWDPGPGYPMGELLDIATHGAHTVPPPPATVTLKLGDKGPAVAFAIGMLNILAKFRVPASGKGYGAQIPVKPVAVYDNMVREAVREFQRFTVVMWTMSGKKGKKPEVNGVIDKETAANISYWVPAALNNG